MSSNISVGGVLLVLTGGSRWVEVLAAIRTPYLSVLLSNVESQPALVSGVEWMLEYLTENIFFCRIFIR